MLRAGADVVRVSDIARRADGPHHLVGHDLREADDGVQGRAQLVAHVGEELGLAAARQLGLFLGGDERQFGFLAVGDVQGRGDDERRGVVVQQRLRREQHAPLAAGAGDVLLERARLIRPRDEAAVALHRGTRRKIVAQLDRRAADDRGGRLADAAGEEFVDEDEAAVAVRGAHHHRHGVDDAHQQFVARAQGVAVAALLGDHLLLERGGARGEQKLLPPHHQKIARADAEFVMIDRAQQEVGGARLERLQTQLAVLGRGHGDDRHFGTARERAEAADELDAVELRHLDVGDDEVGRLRRGGGKQRRRALVGRHRHPLVERAREPLENLPIRQALIDDGDGLALLHAGMNAPANNTLMSSKVC